jgi:hypothetical protein
MRASPRRGRSAATVLPSDAVRTPWDTPRLGALAALALFGWACGAGGAVDAADGGVGPDAGLPGRLEVGTGVLEFAELDPNAPTPLTAGPQASGRYEGYHIWISLRLTDVDVDTLATYAARVRTVDGQVAAEVIRDAARAPFEEDAKGRVVLTGLAPRLADCCAVGGQRFIAEAELFDQAGRGILARAQGVAGTCPECP